MMTKRELCGDMVSLLGFGTMRFPTLEDGNIDEVRASEMLKYAIDNGVNYFDTARPYHNGESEKFVGRFLSQYPRDSFYLATKLPFWDFKTVDEALAIFDKQLSFLKTDYVDFYLFHAINKERFETIKELGLIDVFNNLKKEGKIRHLGFSFHDSYEAFEEIVNYYDWEFCQIQINYMDTEYQAGLKGIELCEKRGIPLIAMEPIRGGALVGFDDDIINIFKSHDDRSLAAWALGWVGSIEQIKTVLSGMSTLEHVKDNLSTFDEFKEFGSEENKVVERAVKVIRSRNFNACTKCRYCMPCPAGVDIPKNFAIANEGAMYGNKKRTRNQLENMEGKASLCIECGKCEKLCPQSIPIREDLKRVQNI